MTKKHKSKVHTILKKRYRDKVSKLTKSKYYFDEQGNWKNVCVIGAGLGKNIWTPYWEDNFDRVFVIRKKLYKKIDFCFDEKTRISKSFWNDVKNRYGTVKEICFYSATDNTLYECCERFEPRIIPRVNCEDLIKTSHSMVVCDDEFLPTIKDLIRKQTELNRLYKKSRIAESVIYHIITDICHKNLLSEWHYASGARLTKINLKLPNCDHLYVKMIRGTVEITFMEDIVEVNVL